jgi:hypothetical protein
MPGKSLALLQVIYSKWKDRANEAVQGVAIAIKKYGNARKLLINI